MMSENNKFLQELLTCKVCQKYFVNPIILPCSNHVCDEHIKQNITDNDSNIYKCNFCKNDHQIPENGFILTKSFIEMMNMNLHLNENTKTAKKQIDDLDNLNKEIDIILKDPKDFIYSYFSKEINKIDLRRETLFAKINDISDEMINKIKQMEMDSKSNLVERQQNLIDANKFDFKELTDRVLIWKEEIRNPKLEESRLKEIIEESSNLLKKNESESFEAKNKILNEKGCYFSSDNDEFKSNLFGELIIDNFSTSYIREKLNSSIVFDSSIVSLDQSNELIKLCEFKDIKEFKLLYRASRDGFSSKAFHSKCDKIPKTLTIIKVKDKPHIFGGYTEATWEGNQIYKQDPNAFIFSLVNNDSKPIKMNVNEKFRKAIYCSSSYGPLFGGEGLDDFYISSGSNTNTNSYSNLGDTYPHPNYQLGSNEAKNFLAGSYNFSTSEIEVFQVR